MNRRLKLSSVIILMTLLFQACNEDVINTDETSNKDFELSEKLILNKSTSNVSNLFLNMGVTSINVSKYLEYTIYDFESEKAFIMNSELINLSDYSVILQDEMISINSKPNLKLTLLDSQPYIKSEGYSGFIDTQTNFNSIEFNILLFFLKEITTSNENKIDTQKVLNNSQAKLSCSFWDTYYVYNTGGSRSVAEAGLQDEINDYTNGFNTLDLSDCTAFGSVDTSCLWENHACVSTQAFCCN